MVSTMVVEEAWGNLVLDVDALVCRCTRVGIAAAVRGDATVHARMML